MVWTDLDNATASSVYNFVTLQETKYFQNSIYEAAQRTASSVFQALSSDTANKSDVSLANLENADACQTVQVFIVIILFF